MSAILVIQKEHELYFGTDSAISTIIDDQIIRIEEDGKKIWIIEDKLIFCAGNMNIAHTLINKYIDSNIKSVELLRELAIELFDNKFMLEIIIGTIKNNKTVVYQISSYNDFEIIERTVKNKEIGLWSGGIRTKECFNIACSELRKGKSPKDIYQNTFDNISFEGIGGILDVYKLDKNKIDLIYSGSIVEKIIKKIYIGEKYLINAETFWGKTIISNEGLFDGIDIYDGGINPVVEIGKYMDGIVEKKGIRISNGSFQIVPQTGVVSNGVELDENGLIISKTNGTTTLTHRTILNATDGFKIQKNTSTFSSPVWENVVSINADTGKLKLSNIEASGDIEASTLSATTKLKVGNVDVMDLITNGLNNDVYANLIEGKTIKAGTLTADKIVAGSLVVGTNVTMGLGSVINWNNVTPPTSYQVGALSTNWVGATHIDAYGLYTGTINANQINGGTINGVNINTIPSIDATSTSTYIEMAGSKITGKSSVRNYYTIGTGVVTGEHKSGIFRSTTYLNDGNDIADYTMDILYNSIMVQGSPLIIGGQAENQGLIVCSNVTGVSKVLSAGSIMDVRGRMTCFTLATSNYGTSEPSGGYGGDVYFQYS